MARKDIHQKLCYLPRKIISLHGTDHAANIVLHELCQKDCFNFSKAAYFVDNPDFNCFKGVAGFCRNEFENIDKKNENNPEQLSELLCSLPFNQKVRCCLQKSTNKQHTLESNELENIAHELGMQKPKVYAWDTKFNNHGLLLYENEQDDEVLSDDLLNGLILLSFCPIH